MDLSTQYLGFNLDNPIVPSAGPMTAELDSIRRLEDAGAAAVVLPSLFEEQLRHEVFELDYHLQHGTESFSEALSYFPTGDEFRLGPDEYLKHVGTVKQAVDIPVIASLNGASLGGWTEYARQIEAAGADALELNIYYVAAEFEMSGAEVEQRYVDILNAVKSSIDVPVAVKIGPYFSCLPRFARRLDEGGADGLVLFNRFYQPDIDLEALEVVPNLVLSTSTELRLPMRWIAILAGRLRGSLAATTGVHTPEDVLKLVMAGADITQVCSLLLKHGCDAIPRLLDGVRQWMEENEYESIEQMKGSMSQRACPDPAAFERANYMKTLQRYV